jgi:hypothetical protein
MLQVKVYAIDGDGETQPRGTISLQDGNLVADPPNDKLLKSFLDPDEVLYEGTAKITPAHPEEYLRHLNNHYYRGHCVVSEAREVPDQPIGKAVMT